MKKSAKLTDGSIAKTLIKLTAPMILGFVSMVAFNLVDTYFVGKLGTNELAALSFTFPVILVIISIALGIGIGVSALVSIAIGEGDHHKVQRITTDGLVLAFLIVVSFVIIGFFTIEILFKALGATPEIVPLIKEYMTIWYAGMPFVVVPMIANNAIRATGDTITPTIIMLVAVTVNSIMDPLLIFGLGPFPNLGIKGAAIATVIARFITFLVALWIIYHREKMINFKFTKLKEIFQSWKSILFIGLPIAGARVITPITIGIITSIIAKYGPKYVAGFGVASRIQFFALAVVRSLAAVFGPFIGQNLGAKKIHRIERGIVLSENFSIITGALIFIILLLFSRSIAGIFNKDSIVIETIVFYLSIVPISYGFQGILLISNTSLNVFHKPFQAAGLVIMQMFVFCIPFAYLGSHFFGIKGIFSGIALAYCLAGIIAHFALKKHLILLKK